MSEERHYNVWYKGAGWTSAPHPTKAHGEKSPARLTIQEAREFLPKAAAHHTNRESSYEVRRIDPKDHLNSFLLTDEDTASLPPKTTATLQSFRLGDTVFVYLDTNGEISATPTDNTVQATIIGRSPRYYVLGWKLFDPICAKPRRRSSQGIEYVADDSKYTRSCMVRPNTPCTMKKPSKPTFVAKPRDTVGAARLGEEIELYVDANDRVVAFETVATTKATVVGTNGDEGPVNVGWKTGEPKPMDLTRSTSGDPLTVVENEADYEMVVSYAREMPCKLSEPIPIAAPGPSAEEKQEQPAAIPDKVKAGAFKLGDRVSYEFLSHKHTGIYLGRAGHDAYNEWVLTDNKDGTCDVFGCHAAYEDWFRGTGGKLRVLAESIGLTTRTDGKDMLQISSPSTQLTLLPPDIPSTTIPTEASSTMPSTEATAQGGSAMGYAVMAGLTLAGAAVSKFLDTTPEAKEVIRVNEPAAIDSVVIEQETTQEAAL